MGRYEGDGSYQKLIKDTYGTLKNGIKPNYKENGSEIRADEQAIQLIFSFIRSGNFAYGSGIGTNREKTGGNYWENKTVSNQTYAFNLHLYYYFIQPQAAYTKSDGYSVRWGGK